MRQNFDLVCVAKFADSELYESDLQQKASLRDFSNFLLKLSYLIKKSPELHVGFGHNNCSPVSKSNGLFKDDIFNDRFTRMDHSV